MNGRLAGIDFGRSSAALIVYAGHLFFLTGYISGKQGIHFFLSPIHNGSTAVLFFFTLSGYVLSKQTQRKKANLNWLIARYIRLMPVYYVAFIIPMCVQISTGSLSTDTVGILLGIFALQSQVTKYALEINGPLWSVSVELLLCTTFMFFSKFRNSRTVYFLSILFVILNATKLGQNPLINGIPYFYLGVWLQSKNFSWEKFIESKVNLSGIIISYLFLSPLFLVELHPVIDNLLNLIVFSFGIICLRNAKMKPKTESRSIEIGKRSYSFYCVHFPIIQMMLIWLSPQSLSVFAVYILLTTFLVLLATEICYRYVEKPAVETGRKFRDK